MDHQSLKHILADKSVAATAALLHVTPRTVYRWCKTRGVSRRAYRCPDPQLLRRLEANGTLKPNHLLVAQPIQDGLSRNCIRLPKTRPEEHPWYLLDQTK